MKKWKVWTISIVVAFTFAAWPTIRQLRRDSLTVIGPNGSGATVTLREEVSYDAIATVSWKRSDLLAHRELWNSFDVTFTKQVWPRRAPDEHYLGARILGVGNPYTINVELATGEIEKNIPACFGANCQPASKRWEGIKLFDFSQGDPWDSEKGQYPVLDIADAWYLTWNADGTAIQSRHNLELKQVGFGGMWIRDAIQQLVLRCLLIIGARFAAIMLLLFLIVFFRRQVTRVRKKLLKRSGLCPECRYDLQGRGIVNGCSECGWGR